MILKRVAEYIRNENLFSSGDKLLVALSGGADSVALLSILIRLGYRCEAVHCNFHLRGEESDRDEYFVRELCCKWNIPLFVTQFDTLEYVERNKLSVEMAARELRYDFFYELKKEHSFDKIVVAHHRDDSVETLLINLIRGTGINGLTGIKPVNGDVVRPLLCVSREEVITYLESCKQSYVTDHTNLENEYLRNKIRLDILPLLKKINPSVKESIANTARNLADVAELYHYGIEKGKLNVLEEGNIRIDRLMDEPAPRSLLFEILSPLGFNGSQVEDVWLALKGEPGKRFISKNWTVIKDRGLLLIRNNNDEIRKADLNDLEFHICSIENFRINPDKTMAYLDADKLTEPFCIRRWQKGDWFIPFGMKGRKLLSDYLTDRKFSLPDKEQQHVLLAGKSIVWVVGERIDDRFKITSETKRVMIIKKR